MVGPDVLWRNITDTRIPETSACRIASLSELGQKPIFEALHRKGDATCPRSRFFVHLPRTSARYGSRLRYRHLPEALLYETRAAHGGIGRICFPEMHQRFPLTLLAY